MSKTQPSPSRQAGDSKLQSAARSRVMGAVRSVATSKLLSRQSLWVWPILAALFLAVVGWWIRGTIESELKQGIAADLKTILDTEASALKFWFQSERDTVLALSQDETVRATSQEITRKVLGDGLDQLQILQLPELNTLRREIQPTLDAHGFHGFLVITPTGQVVAAMRNDPVGLVDNSETVIEMLQRAEQFGSTVTIPMKSRIMLPDAQGTMRAELPTMFTVAPLKDDQGATFAFLALRIRPEDEFTETLRIAWPGESGETYAFAKSGIMLSQSRFDDDLRQIGLLTEDAVSLLNVAVRDPLVNMTEGQRPELKRSEQALTRMAAAAIQGEAGVDVNGYRDYRGVPVVGAWTWLDEYSMGLATEVDLAEAYRPLRTLRLAFWSMFVLLAGLSIGIFAFTVVVARLNQEARRAAIEARQLGQYSLDEKLGEGGMGVVYRAHHALLHRPTAVKFLDVDRTNEQTIARFEREVRITSRLTHPNTIAVYDYGRTPEGIFYYAMEYLDGIDLEQLVHEYGPLPDGRVVKILEQAAGSLTEAHACGLIHRDIKPANLLLTQRGGIPDFVKVLDFGLVKAMDGRSEAALTAAGTMAGTPLYLSPEGIQRPADVDERSDLYSLAAVGYFLLTGSPVFDAESVLAIISQHVNAQPEPIASRSHRPVAAELEQLLMQTLAKNPEQRPASAAEFAERLLRIQPHVPWSRPDAQRWWNQRTGQDGSGQDGSGPAGANANQTVIGGMGTDPGATVIDVRTNNPVADSGDSP